MWSGRGGSVGCSLVCLLVSCAQPPEDLTAERFAVSGAALKAEPRVYAVALNADLSLDLPLPARMAAVSALQDSLLDGFAEGELEVVRRFQLVPGLAIRDPGPDVLARLAAHPKVRGVGPDEGGAAHLNQSAAFIGAPAVHAGGRTGQGRVVAVIDTGVDTDHPDVAADLVGGACFCASGTNCCGPSGSTGVGLASAEDDTGHGTHVTGIITSAGTVAPPGIAPSARAVVVRVMRNGRFSNTSDLVSALEWIRLNHPSVDAINLSLGTTTLYPANCEVADGPYTPPTFMVNLTVAFDLVRQAGIVPVASAGNDSDTARSGAPGCLTNVFTVGASANAANTVASFSNSNRAVDVWAPGANILSSHLIGTAASLSGTSMSAPHVSAAAALVNQANPFHPVGTVEACLRTSSTTITDARNGISRPRLDLVAAVGACGDFALGAACSVSGECASGFCVDGVCCNQACGAGAVDCRACSVAAGAQVDGQCATARGGAACRPSAGACDVAEVCDGVATTCPADAFIAAGVQCRASAGACDLVESCSGSAPVCPPDAKFGGICRPSAGACDRPESCDGINDDCPADILWGTSIECRPAAGPCDVGEVCTGNQPACPPDGFRQDECRPSAGPCDPAERCSGSAAACPADLRAPATEVCRASVGACDRPELCDGTNPACPEDIKRVSVCRPSAGGCDVAEVCDGASDLCPADGFSTAGTECRAAAGDCDVPEVCPGDTAACPQDVLRTGECRAVAGACDVAEVCDGVSPSCGPDVVRSSTVTCRASTGSCDLAEACDGRNPTCPDDGWATDGTSCADGRACNGEEVCAGGACAPGSAPSCDDGDPCTVGSCVEPDGCEQTRVEGCCAADVDCDDGDLCTADTCSAPGGTCAHAEIEGCCRTDAACDDGVRCTVDRCEAGACVSTLTEGCCEIDADCQSQAGICETGSCINGTCQFRPLRDCDNPSCTTPGPVQGREAPWAWSLLLAGAALLRPRRRR